ncbi:hypothetical protein [Candidatus Bodocaedibacter vickermanii]|uniref:PQQ-like domain-containing protein n=1 Tax=Candidatus Bodocaedibacter vickermanii TaxID=2741701 RepID=A0A7L9RU24_9PROT|nr:hypothetical protein CPBP_00900 [Candidatus Paracaedibacteraceae bacterium 'Lake Konstanz']
MFKFLQNIKIRQLSNKYKQDSFKYTKLVNDYRVLGEKTNWKVRPEVEAPEDNRHTYAKQLFETLVQFNKSGKAKELRTLFPPQTEPFYSLTEEKPDISNIHKIIAVSDEIFLVSIDESKFSNENNKWFFQRNCYVYKDSMFQVLDGVGDFGICPQRKIIAFLKDDGIHLKENWDDKSKLVLAWPQGTIYFADGTIAAKNQETLKFLGDTCIPFSDGKRVLLGGFCNGLFLVDDEKTTAIFPDKQYIADYASEDERDPLNEKDIFSHGDYSMFHFSLSHSNELISLGHQCSSHHLYSVNGSRLGSVEPISAYPHYSLFSKDDTQACFNSCHFYNGGTLAVQVDELKSNQLPEKQFIELDTESRVYAGVTTSFGYIIGDAKGYIRARSYSGEHLWDDYLGFNIQTMDITADEKFLYVGTYKGILYKIELNAGVIDLYKIGTSNNREITRWLFWEKDQIVEW